MIYPLVLELADDGVSIAVALLAAPEQRTAWSRRDNLRALHVACKSGCLPALGKFLLKGVPERFQGPK